MLAFPIAKQKKNIIIFIHFVLDYSIIQENLSDDSGNKFLFAIIEQIKIQIDRKAI